MEINGQEKVKVSVIKNILNKCKYSLDGLKHCFKNETSFMLEAIAGIVIIIMGIFFDIKFVEWVISLGSLMLISITELINTAIEAVVDLVTLEIHPLAKIAKDCGSAATFVLACMAATLGFIVYVPYIIDFIKGIF